MSSLALLHNNPIIRDKSCNINNFLFKKSFGVGVTISVGKKLSVECTKDAGYTLQYTLYNSLITVHVKNKV